MEFICWLSSLLLVASATRVVEADPSDRRRRLFNSNDDYQNMCHIAFIQKLVNVTEKSLNINSTWWPELNPEQTLVFRELADTQVSIFEARSINEAKRFSVQCQLCTQSGQGYPCCLRERTNMVSRILQAKNDLFKPICKKAMEFRVAPENCAYDARHYDATTLVAEMVRCEIRCQGPSKQQAICALSVDNPPAPAGGDKTSSRPAETVTDAPAPEAFAAGNAGQDAYENPVQE